MASGSALLPYWQDAVDTEWGIWNFVSYLVAPVDHCSSPFIMLSAETKLGDWTSAPFLRQLSSKWPPITLPTRVGKILERRELEKGIH